MKKLLLFFLTALTLVVLAACGDDEAADSKSIKLGATAGPYSDMLKKSFIPQLEEKNNRYACKQKNFGKRIF